MKISPSRPRVYLVDFEVAKEFPPEYPADDCVLNGYPLGGSFTCLEMYSRPHAPEFTSGKPYSPFKLDVWQLGTSLSEFKVGVSSASQLIGCSSPDQLSFSRAQSLQSMRFLLE